MSNIKIFPNKKFKVGDLVSRDSEDPPRTYCIIGFKVGDEGEHVAVLKGLFNQPLIAEAPLHDLTNLIVRGKL
ncbi:MAG: hypothetical protein QHH02_07210 [Syntrophomonadaceae bacterium]|nr:hypothetical protein [Syntrophomonadaceae bacterium]